MRKIATMIILALSVISTCCFGAIPLPEHPRPDYQRNEWRNLNGQWNFRFDKDCVGFNEKWFEGKQTFDKKIIVPFPWGSKNSGVKDEAYRAWYQRSIKIPEAWKGKRIFVVVGASDWKTLGWIDGKKIGDHRGGYTPFSFELTHYVKWGEEQSLVFFVDDTRNNNLLWGKQGYGDVHGFWQTVYLEARGNTYLDDVHLVPDIDNSQVKVKVNLSGPAKDALKFTLKFKNGAYADATHDFAVGQRTAEFNVPMKNFKLWSLDDPYLYEVTASLKGDNTNDELDSYFGMRKISVTRILGLNYPYVALNNKPIYLQMALDQSYHPDGHYTFPSDEFMKNEILISKKLGLNCNRIHIKVEVPRKLYWADKLGLLIMADVPNWWGYASQESFREWEYCFRNQVKRDMNHPSIFCWVLFNETWGLRSEIVEKNGKKRGVYTPETQEKVADCYYMAKQLDSSRFVEDNSPCNQDHVITDLNTWHSYNAGYNWYGVVKAYSNNTFPGSKKNYINGYRQTDIPMMNSECGNVWGYKNSTGDVDFSWDYHAMINAFRRFPKCSGWLYTEHHDVCNEWNGYVKFDRTPKFTGIEELFPGMSLNDFHSDAYVSLDKELCRTFKTGETYSLPMYLSLTTCRYEGKKLSLSADMRVWDSLGNEKVVALANAERSIAAKSWQHEELKPLEVKLPEYPSLGLVRVTLRDGDKVIGRNFAMFVTRAGELARKENVNGKQVVRVAPKAFTKAEWSLLQWNILDGLKVNGAGKGFFEYEIPLADIKLTDKSKVEFLAEISSKRLNAKDRKNVKLSSDLDYMVGGGYRDPSANENSYPMTSTYKYAGEVVISVNGVDCGTVQLENDPADHRGILSWASQPRDRTLKEAGSYGYLVKVNIPAGAIEKAKKEGKLVLRLASNKDTGLALYGESFGRYPMDLTFVISE